MKKIIQSTKMDENFYTLPKHAPDRDLTVNNCVTDGLIDILRAICDKLDLEFIDVGWDILTKPRYREFKAEICDFISDELYKLGIK